MMNEDAKLHTRRINHGQSEIWLEADGRELTQRRILATNEVLNVTRRHCAPEVFDAFYASNRTVVGEVATLVAPNLDEIATELNLRA
jgi:hypothetical protein